MLKAGDWNRDFLDEHEEFPNGRRKDMVDAAAGAFNKLANPALRYDALGRGSMGHDRRAQACISESATVIALELIAADDAMFGEPESRYSQAEPAPS